MTRDSSPHEHNWYRYDEVSTLGLSPGHQDAALSPSWVFKNLIWSHTAHLELSGRVVVVFGETQKTRFYDVLAG